MAREESKWMEEGEIMAENFMKRVDIDLEFASPILNIMLTQIAHQRPGPIFPSIHLWF